MVQIEKFRTFLERRARRIDETILRVNEFRLCIAQIEVECYCIGQSLGV